ncbi:hypothetical protein JZ751_001282 [Albula glossodonta]|uniref:Uncharacterized protein n=1 Tax=Albula glossodonta TaxID=121402 RepID=A0A8T2PTB0_9TELE|nr:hypothetical protein JZ751_001282 [Albula glossodonta]
MQKFKLRRNLHSQERPASIYNPNWLEHLRTALSQHIMFRQRVLPCVGRRVFGDQGQCDQQTL